MSKISALAIVFFMLLSGCGQSTTSVCTLDTSDGRNRTCLVFDSGFSDSAVTESCRSQAGTLGPGPCAPGFARCVLVRDGRGFTTHFLEPGDVNFARMVCTVAGGTFELP